MARLGAPIRQPTAWLEVNASGDWVIEAIPLKLAWQDHVLNVPGTFEDSRDNVIFLGDNYPDRAKIQGNAHSGYFGVIAYNGGWDLLVNTTDPYDGTVKLHRDSYALEIKATGPWSISISSR